MTDWHIESPIQQPTLRQLWREWRCGRKHAHGPDGFYAPNVIQRANGRRAWAQECQCCGRFTIWSEREVAS